jgi:hypothetical protein
MTRYWTGMKQTTWYSTTKYAYQVSEMWAMWQSWPPNTVQFVCCVGSTVSVSTKQEVQTARSGRQSPYTAGLRASNSPPS